jgi:hypothetical protein
MATTTQESPAAVTALSPPRLSSAPAMQHAAAADIGALLQAKNDRQVTFNDVARAWFIVCDDELPDVERARCQELFPQLLSAFGRPRGGVLTAYFCRHVRIVSRCRRRAS